MKWHIITDSSSDLFTLDQIRTGKDIDFATVPFFFDIDGQEFVDDESLDLPSLISAMEASKHACRSSCPAPEAWHSQFSREGNVIAVTISAELSGSYNSALTAVSMIREEQPDKKMAVLNSCSTGPGLILIVNKLVEMINCGLDFDAVISRTETYIHQLNTIFALCSFTNLVKNGRVSKLSAIAARTLKLWGVGAGSPEGKIVMLGKHRGNARTVKAIVQDFLSKNTNHSNLVISHCRNESFALSLRDSFLAAYPKMRIRIFETRGLDSFYAEDQGVIIAYDNH